LKWQQNGSETAKVTAATSTRGLLIRATTAATKTQVQSSLYGSNIMGSTILDKHLSLLSSSVEGLQSFGRLLDYFWENLIVKCK